MQNSFRVTILISSQVTTETDSIILSFRDDSNSTTSNLLLKWEFPIMMENFMGVIFHILTVFAGFREMHSYHRGAEVSKQSQRLNSTMTLLKLILKKWSGWPKTAHKDWLNTPFQTL